MDYKYYELKKDLTTYYYYYSLANLFPGPEGRICQATAIIATPPQYHYYCYTMHVLRNTDCGSAAHRNPNVEQIPIMYDFYYSGGVYIGKMLDEFGLINMNGRCYDPVVGRFLSPDLIVQNPNNTQCYNRYSYCINNPLKYSDPSGWVYDQSWTHRHNANVVNHNFLDRLWGHNWKFSEEKEWFALIEATGGNSLNNAGEPLDLLDIYANNVKMDNSLSVFNNSFFTIIVDKDISNQFDKMIGEKNYKGAVKFLIDTYKLDKNMLGDNVNIEENYSVNIRDDDFDINHAYASYGKLKADIIIPTGILKANKFAVIIGMVYHELIHTYQVYKLNMGGDDLRNLREFQCYYYCNNPNMYIPLDEGLILSNYYSMVHKYSGRLTLEQNMDNKNRLMYMQAWVHLYNQLY